MKVVVAVVVVASMQDKVDYQMMMMLLLLMMMMLLCCLLLLLIHHKPINKENEISHVIKVKEYPTHTCNKSKYLVYMYVSHPLTLFTHTHTLTRVSPPVVGILFPNRFSAPVFASGVVMSGAFKHD